MNAIAPLDLSSHRSCVVLTGAGISVASGLRPYRGAGGLWTERPDQIDVATTDTLVRDPAAIWRLFGPMRAAARAARPNAAHIALAELERRALSLGGACTVITQNVDGLHQRAGSTEVVEIHGRLARSRCSRCDRPPFDDTSAHDLPLCDRCGAPLRPDVVLFGEYPDVDDEHRAKRALRECDLFLAIGTSGTVAPASSYVRWAEVNGARTILIDIAPPDPPSPAFREVLTGRAEDLVPALVGA